MRVGTHKLIEKIPGYEKYLGTDVSIVKVHPVDEENMSRMFLVRLIDGKIITVFEDEIEEIA